MATFHGIPHSSAHAAVAAAAAAAVRAAPGSELFLLLDDLNPEEDETETSSTEDDDADAQHHLSVLDGVSEHDGTGGNAAYPGQHRRLGRRGRASSLCSDWSSESNAAVRLSPRPSVVSLLVLDHDPDPDISHDTSILDHDNLMSKSVAPAAEPLHDRVPDVYITSDVDLDGSDRSNVLLDATEAAGATGSSGGGLNAAPITRPAALAAPTPTTPALSQRRSASLFSFKIGGDAGASSSRNSIAGDFDQATAHSNVGDRDDDHANQLALATTHAATVAAATAAILTTSEPVYHPYHVHHARHIQPRRPLLPLPVASIISSLASASRASIRITSTLVSAVSESIKFSASASLGITRRVMVAAVSSARSLHLRMIRQQQQQKQQSSTPTSTALVPVDSFLVPWTPDDTKPFLNILDRYTRLSINTIHHAFSLTELLTHTTFHLATTTIKFSLTAAEEVVDVFDGLFGETETSRAIAAFVCIFVDEWYGQDDALVPLLLGNKTDWDDGGNANTTGSTTGGLGKLYVLGQITKAMLAYGCLQYVTRKRWRSLIRLTPVFVGRAPKVRGAYDPASETVSMGMFDTGGNAPSRSMNSHANATTNAASSATAAMPSIVNAASSLSAAGVLGGVNPSIPSTRGLPQLPKLAVAPTTAWSIGDSVCDQSMPTPRLRRRRSMDLTPIMKWGVSPLEPLDRQHQSMKKTSSLPNSQSTSSDDTLLQASDGVNRQSMLEPHVNAWLVGQDAHHGLRRRCRSGTSLSIKHAHHFENGSSSISNNMVTTNGVSRIGCHDGRSRSRTDAGLLGIHGSSFPIPVSIRDEPVSSGYTETAGLIDTDGVDTHGCDAGTVETMYPTPPPPTREHGRSDTRHVGANQQPDGGMVVDSVPDEVVHEHDALVPSSMPVDTVPHPMSSSSYTQIEMASRFIKFATGAYGTNFLRILGLGRSRELELDMVIPTMNGPTSPSTATSSSEMMVDRDHGAVDLNHVHGGYHTRNGGGSRHTDADNMDWERDHHNHQSLAIHANIPVDHIVTSSFIDPGDVTTPPTSLLAPVHYVVVDRATRSVVVCLRGTLGLSDLVTDLTASYVYYRTKAPAQVTGYVHAGIFKSAMHIAKSAVCDAVRDSLVRHPGYALVLTGHSLGGGCAALVSMLWSRRVHDPVTMSDMFVTDDKTTRLPPNRPIHCYVYGCPAIMSADLSKFYKPLISCFVFRNDVVPCLSFGLIRDFRNVTINLCQEKGMAEKVIGKVLGVFRDANGRGQGDATRRPGESGKYDRRSDEDVSFDSLWFWAVLKTLRADMRADKLYPPGTVYWINAPTLAPTSMMAGSSSFDAAGMDGSATKMRVPTPPMSSESPQKTKTASSESPSQPSSTIPISLHQVDDVETAFGELTFSTRMFTDHSPHHYEGSLELLTRALKLCDHGTKS